jgi:hypothetical protein
MLTPEAKESTLCYVTFSVSEPIRMSNTCVLSLESWYIPGGVDSADLDIFCMSRGTKSTPFLFFSSLCQVSLWDFFSADPLHLLDFIFSISTQDPRFCSCPTVLSQRRETRVYSRSEL